MSAPAERTPLSIKRADFNHDGCKTAADVRERQQMLSNIASGLRSGSVLIAARVWKLGGRND